MARPFRAAETCSVGARLGTPHPRRVNRGFGMTVGTFLRRRFGQATLVMITAVSAVPLAGQAAPPSATRVIVQNPYVTVREVRWARGESPPTSDRHDVVRVYLEGRPTGQVSFHPLSERVALEPGVSVLASADTHAIVIELDASPPPYLNRTGLPPAFPRPGSKRVLDNDRVVVWDYTFALNQPSPLHFHERDVVVVFLGEGTLASTPLEGPVTTRDHTNGMTLFNPGNRAHTETLVRGTGRVIVVEFK
jgi:hypothetical protein